MLGKAGMRKRISGRLTWISQHLEANKCVAPSLGQDVSRGTTGGNGSGTESVDCGTRKRFKQRCDLARFLIYDDLQTPKGWTGWEAGRPERKEAMRPELGKRGRDCMVAKPMPGKLGEGKG